jgi:hypothetical protein
MQERTGRDIEKMWRGQRRLTVLLNSVGEKLCARAGELSQKKFIGAQKFIFIR